MQQLKLKNDKLKPYAEYIDDISSDELYQGMVGFGLFAEKIPNFLTSETFLDYTKTLSLPLKMAPKDYIRYSSMRNTNVPRQLAIPEPFSYANQCYTLAQNWSLIKDHFRNKTAGNPYKISRIHIRKLFGKQALFEMNYKNFRDDGEPEQDIVIKSRYVAEVDISACFPSIYSHSISWSLVGKELAKTTSKSTKANNSLWYNKLDYYTRCMKFGETNGLLIGPHTSNLISEIILTTVDEKINDHGFKYIRNIDDYTCYTESYEEAERFIMMLSDELAKYELSLNNKKTKIASLPKANVRNWVPKLNHFNFTNTYQIDGETAIRVKELKGFFDFVLELMVENNYDAAILNYSIKILSNKHLGKNAKQYYYKQLHHLVLLYPYLISLLEDNVFIPHSIPKAIIKEIANNLFELGINKRLYEACSYTIHWAIKYDFEINHNDLKDKAIKSNDCIFLLISYLYDKKTKSASYLKEYKNHAKALKAIDFDRYWLFIYEVLPWTELSNHLRAMKKRGISFIIDGY